MDNTKLDGIPTKVRDHRQITFVMLNGFCPLSKPSTPCPQWTRPGWTESLAKLNEKHMPDGALYFKF